MAGDWIKMRADLAEDPAVIGMASALGVDEDLIVGKLHRLWSWADRQSRDGHATGVTQIWIDRYIRCDGFAQAMVAVGWLEVEGASVTFPNFDRHNGETAKTRALGTKRKQKQRSVDPVNVTQSVTYVSRTERDKSETREEKRREEKEQVPPISPSGGHPVDELKPKRAKRANAGITYADFVVACKADGEHLIPEDHAVFGFATDAQIPRDFLELAWREFARQYRPTSKTQAGKSGWRQKFENCVRRNWFKLWWFPANGQCELTTAGQQLKRERDAA